MDFYFLQFIIPVHARLHAMPGGAHRLAYTFFSTREYNHTQLLWHERRNRHEGLHDSADFRSRHQHQAHASSDIDNYLNSRSTLVCFVACRLHYQGVCSPCMPHLQPNLTETTVHVHVHVHSTST